MFDDDGVAGNYETMPSLGGSGAASLFIVSR
jgi:hypothetical protein